MASQSSQRGSPLSKEEKLYLESRSGKLLTTSLPRWGHPNDVFYARLDVDGSRQRRIRAVPLLTQCRRQAKTSKITENTIDHDSGACMTRTPPDGARGDVKAHAWLGQNARDHTVCRSVWPASPTQPALCRARRPTPTTKHGQASGNSSSVNLSH